MYTCIHVVCYINCMIVYIPALDECDRKIGTEEVALSEMCNVQYYNICIYAYTCTCECVSVHCTYMYIVHEIS